MGMSIDAAVIGCGRMGAFTSPAVQRFAPPCWLPLAHAEAIRRHPSLVLRALSDVDPAALRRAAEAYKVARTFEDPNRMIDEVRPGLLGVATRTIGRAEILLRGVACGVRAFHVEKPLCNSMRELLEVEEAFVLGDRFLSYGTIRRFLSPYRQAVEIARSGQYGALLEVQVNLGRGALYWTHPHSVDLLLYATGGAAVESVSARLSNVVAGETACIIESDPVVESATVLFEGGIEGRITRMPGCDLVLACEQGQVIVEADGRDVVTYAPAGDDAYCGRVPVAVGHSAPSGTLAPVSHLVQCLQGDPAAVRLNESTRNDVFVGQRILFGLLQSHVRGGRPVALAELADDWVILARSGGRHA
jgi:scyllo-inositol 2-dehydrogenase (NAD+)